MIRRILDYINKYSMLDDCDGIVAGLSGGADSVCLVSALTELMRGTASGTANGVEDIPIIAVHVNHGIRGEEADRDEQYAKSLADSLGIRFVSFTLDIPARARQEGISEETAGRIARYECFRKVIKDEGFKNGRIAVAHHMNDQAETVLMHLIRGSSLDGLAGMQPVAGDVIRPLLCVSKEEILDYLKDRQLTYMTDSTNEDNSYTRNMVRNCIIPEIERINPRFVQSVSNTAADISKYVEYTDRMADNLKDVMSVRADGSVHISILAADDEPLLMRKNIKRAYSEVHGDIVNLYRSHIDAVYELKDRECGKCVNLPGAVMAVRDYDGIVLKNVTAGDGLPDRETGYLEIDISADGQAQLPWDTGNGISKVVWNIRPVTDINDKELINISDNDYTMYFDYDKMGVNPIFRFRRTGDSCTIDSDGHRKRLKQEFIDRKVPSEQRDRVLLMTIDSDVLWAVGVRRYRQMMVTGDTKRVLVVSLI